MAWHETGAGRQRAPAAVSSARSAASIAYPLRDEPWGQRRFGLYDPAGTWVDVIEQIDPAPGFWDKYLT